MQKKIKIPDHISYSSLSTFGECPLRWKFTYVEKIPQIVSARLLLGRAMHGTLEAYFKHKEQSGFDPPLDAAIKTFEAKLNREANLPSITDPNEKLTETIDWSDTSIEELQVKGQRVLKKYLEEVAPFFTPRAIENWLEMPVAGQNITRLVGRVDLITDKDVVIDFKTTKYPWPKDRIATSLQPFIYATLIGKPIVFEYHFIVVNGNSATTAIRRIERSQSDIDWIKKHYIPNMVVLMETERYPPNPGMRCSYCSYVTQCGFPLAPIVAAQSPEL